MIRPTVHFIRLSLEELEPRAVPTLLGNTLFPADNPWNHKITAAPVAANSNALVQSIGADTSFHPDFGTVYNGALNGIPYNVVTKNQPKVSVTIDGYPGESDLLPVPIPDNAAIEGDPLPPADNQGDRHLIVYDQDNNVVYELFFAYRPAETTDHLWHAGSEAVWDLNKNTFRTAGNTSADAAGLPILPGLVRPDEVLDQGVIDHALRFTVAKSQNAYVFPASHSAGTADPTLPRMGERFRLHSDFDVSAYPKDDQVILQALKDYGMIVADNGGNWFLSGTPSSRWNTDDLSRLTELTGSDFEAVDLTPVVASLDTVVGPPSGGTTVTITGQNFTGDVGQTQVFFGTTAATGVHILSDTQITAIAPALPAGEAVDVTVQSGYGTSAAIAEDRFTPVARPVVTGLSATAGTLDGGPVTLTGSDLAGATSVRFGSLDASFTVNDDGTIDAVAPPQDAGTVDVRVITLGGTSAVTAADQFSYVAPPTVAGLGQPTGPLAGGTVVTLTGANLAGATQVAFDGAPVAFVVNADGTLTATAPAHDGGSIDVVVTTPGGTSPTVAEDQFTYVSPPAITGVKHSSGPIVGGTAVTITGDNLATTTIVFFGDQPAASITVNDDGTLTAIAPPHPAGTVPLTVVAAGGVSDPVAAGRFSFVSYPGRPAIFFLTLRRGPTAGGTPVTIVGRQLAHVDRVLFGNVAASSFRVLSRTLLIAIAPPQAAGVVDVQVSTVGGLSPVVRADRFTYFGAPTLTAMLPNQGSAQGGTDVTLTGTNFVAGATQVYFGEKVADSVQVLSPTSLRVTVPAHNKGSVPLFVTTADGVSNEELFVYA